MQTNSSSRTNYTDGVRKYQLQTPASFSLISLILLGFISVALYAQIAALGDLRDKVPEFLACYWVLFVIYVVACSHAERSPRDLPVWAVLAIASLFRITMLFSPPSLSDDIYRYQWEGYLQTQGVNPYCHAPEALELAPLQNEIWEKVNNKDVSAIYPPLIQIIQAGLFLTLRAVWTYKLFFIAVEALLVGVLLNLLLIYGKSNATILLYAWNPLVVVEIAGSGHHDSCVVALLFASLLLCLTERPRRSVITFAGAVLCKLYPLAGLPFLLKKIPLRHLVWLPLTVAAGYLPFVGAGRRLFAALLYYREKWRFNGFLFHELTSLLSDEAMVERWLLLGILFVIVGCLARKGNILEQFYWMTGAVLLCAPALFPWYLIWMVPFLCLFHSSAWLLLTALAPLSYYVLIDWWTLGIWSQNELFLKLQYYPFYGLLALNFLNSILRLRKTRSLSVGSHNLPAQLDGPG